jgi:hypothetical protein
MFLKLIHYLSRNLEYIVFVLFTLKFTAILYSPIILINYDYKDTKGSLVPKENSQITLFFL